MIRIDRSAVAVDQLKPSITLPFDALAVSIGIATGTVVGETPNLAVRLQALVSPGEIIIAAQTLCGNSGTVLWSKIS